MGTLSSAVATTVSGAWRISVCGSSGGIGSLRVSVSSVGSVRRAVGGNVGVHGSRNGSVSGSSSGGGNGSSIRRS